MDSDRVHPETASATSSDFAPPMEAYQDLAADQAQRGGYHETIDDLAGYIRERAQDPNLRADVERLWRFAMHYFGLVNGGSNP